MARTKQQIIEAIQTYFIANPILQQIYGITGSNLFPQEFSLTSLEAQLIEVFANEAKTIEDLLDYHLREVNKRLAEMEPGTLLWYRRLALAFQFGHTLLWNPSTMKYEYPIIDEASKIIKLASVNEANGSLLIKVAKLDMSNQPVELSPLELSAFESYFEGEPGPGGNEGVKYAGVNITYVSRPADKLRLKLRVFYNPTLLNNDGSMLSNPTFFPVNEAVKEYLKLLPFNGWFNVTDLVDSLQSTVGVVNPIFIAASGQFGSNPWVPITDYYNPNAGYMVIDDVIPLEVEYVLL